MLPESLPTSCDVSPQAALYPQSTQAASVEKTRAIIMEMLLS